MILRVDQWIIVNGKQSVIVADDDTLKPSLASFKRGRARRPFFRTTPGTSRILPTREQSGDSVLMRTAE